MLRNAHVYGRKLASSPKAAANSKLDIVHLSLFIYILYSYLTFVYVMIELRAYL